MNDCTTNEIWKNIADYEGLYQVSNLGRVRRLKGKRCTSSFRVLRPANCHGYLSVALCKNGKPISFFVHRLVADAFLGNVAGKEINHIDANRRNNTLPNLEIVNRQENIAHSVKTGLVLKGEQLPQSKLTSDQVRLIREKYIPHKYGFIKLSKEFGVSDWTIRDILQRKIWAHI